MTITTEARKPFYALAGTIDLAVETARELPTEVAAKATTLVPQATELATQLPFLAIAQAKELRTQVESTTTTLTLKGLTKYGEFVTRGEKLVGSIRRQKATKDAVAQVKTAKSQTKAATTSTSKAAAKTAKATSDAAAKIG